MMKYILIGALAVSTFLGGLLAYQTYKNTVLQVEVSALTSTVAAMTLQRDIARAAQEFEQERAVRAAANLVVLQENLEAILTGDFTNADAILDPALIAYFECLRRPDADGVHCSGNTSGNPEPLPPE